MSSYIDHVSAREILDSRGNPTVEVDVYLSGGVTGRAAVPSGASTGEREAIEKRDEDKGRYLGKGVLQAVENVNEVISNELVDRDACDQADIDQTLINVDGTDKWAKIHIWDTLGQEQFMALAPLFFRRAVGAFLVFDLTN